jgi:hypothetical protein
MREARDEDKVDLLPCFFMVAANLREKGAKLNSEVCSMLL